MTFFRPSSVVKIFNPHEGQAGRFSWSKCYWKYVIEWKMQEPVKVVLIKTFQLGLIISYEQIRSSAVSLIRNFELKIGHRH